MGKKVKKDYQISKKSIYICPVDIQKNKMAKNNRRVSVKMR
jgi:hypothetical protein